MNKKILKIIKAKFFNQKTYENSRWKEQLIASKQSYKFYILLKKLIWKTQRSLNKGQIIIEGLFFITFAISLFLAVQFFQKQAQKEIQKERLTKPKAFKKMKLPWYRLFN